MLSTNPNESHFALVDCNNFYASCERVFNPRLIGKPIVVLSNNDGCIIARSKEAKQLGIPMGAPVYQYKEIIKKHQVFVCSSNFALYGDLSARVMQTLATCCQDMEIYSVDEAFLLFHPSEGKEQALQIRKKVLQWTGISVSVGVGKTKTLSKVANEHAKGDPEGVCVLVNEPDINQLLQDLPVTEIWGVGRRIGEHLNKLGILTALDLKNASDGLIKKMLGVVTLRTVWELRGISCISFDEIPQPKKSITTSRSFGQAVTDLKDLSEAISTYAARAGEKLREEGSLTSYMEVFMTHKARGSDEYFTQCTHLVLPEPTAYSPLLIHYAKMGIEHLYCEGLLYRKAGIILSDLVSERCYQPDLFTPIAKASSKQKLMHLVDTINEHHGHQVLKWAAEGIEKPWQMKQVLRSPCYTTRWDQLLTVR